MKPLRLLTTIPLALVALFAFTTGSAFADARTDCSGVDAESTGANVASLRTSVICLTNRERVSRGMSALREQKVLTSIAQEHSDDMAQNNYFAHVDRSGGQPWDRAEKAGYTNGWVGENIAGGYTSPLAVMTGWIRSSGHCANILSAQYTEIGIGYASKDDSDYGIYWTMVLGGNDRSAPKVTVKCPYADLASGTVAGVNAVGTKSLAKVKLTVVKRRSDGRYKIGGRVTPVTRRTLVKLTVKRGKKHIKYTVKTTKSGLFQVTLRAPSGSGKVSVAAKL